MDLDFMHLHSVYELGKKKAIMNTAVVDFRVSFL
jgi:hypothetical protein